MKKTAHSKGSHTSVRKWDKMKHLTVLRQHLERKMSIFFAFKLIAPNLDRCVQEEPTILKAKTM